jgi:hypothetical protein
MYRSDVAYLTGTYESKLPRENEVLVRMEEERRYRSEYLSGWHACLFRQRLRQYRVDRETYRSDKTYLIRVY